MSFEKQVVRDCFVECLQVGYEAKLASHKELIESKMSAAITLVKVLQITDSKTFVTTYGQLLEHRMQTPDAMQQCLALLDISKDVAVARINMFRSLGNAGGLAAVCSSSIAFFLCESSRSAGLLAMAAVAGNP